MVDRLKTTQTVAQVETRLPSKQKVTQAIAQVETRLPSKQKVTQLIAQVEYVVSAGGAPTAGQLMRHGAYFNSSGKQRFWWAR
jgi:hypothetical protein